MANEFKVKNGLLVNGDVTLTGNISGSSFFGSGSNLTGVTKPADLTGKLDTSVFASLSGGGAGDFKADGTVPMTGPIKAINGTTANPAYTFSVESVGMSYDNGTSTLSFSVGATEAVGITTDEVRVKSAYTFLSENTEDITPNTYYTGSISSEYGGFSVGGSVQIGKTLHMAESTPVQSIATMGSIAFDGSDNKFKVSEDGGSFVPLIPDLSNYAQLTGSAFTGNVSIAGDLVVQGTTFTVDSQNVLVEDNILTLNAGLSGVTANQAGIEVYRNTEPTAQLLWNELTETWQAGISGSIQDIAFSSTITGITGGLTQLDTRFVNLSGDTMTGALSVQSTLAAPSISGSAANGFIRLVDSEGSRVLDQGISDNPSGAWLQSRDKNDYSVNYPLRLNPNGGVVEVGTGGIKFLDGEGVGVTSSIFDDYEEGNWTPAFVFGTSGSVTSTTFGSYTKIGRQVTCCGFISLSSISSPTGTLQITGLPFAVANIVPADRFRSCALWTFDNLATGKTNSMLGNELVPNTTAINVYDNSSNVITASSVSQDFLSTTTNVRFSVTYFTI